MRLLLGNTITKYLCGVGSFMECISFDIFFFHFFSYFFHDSSRVISPRNQMSIFHLLLQLLTHINTTQYINICSFTFILLLIISVMFTVYAFLWTFSFFSFEWCSFFVFSHFPSAIYTLLPFIQQIHYLVFSWQKSFFGKLFTSTE